jgi:DegV family protein with EDD domain
MNNVAIVTDTTACVPPEYVIQLGIEVVPVQLIIEEKTYSDGIDISPAEFYAMLRKVKKTPTTSSTSPQPYLNAFSNASLRARSILCLTEPAKFSAMYTSARVAAETARDTLKGIAIEVMECTTAAAGQGLVALAAARAAALGPPLADVRKTAGEIMSRVKLFAALDTLQYLVRSGRVPQAAALVNSILSIKPVFTLSPGGARTVALPRTMRSAMDHMLKLMGGAVVKGQKLHVAVMHADALEQAQVFKDRIASRFDCREIFITEFTPVMGAHTGPGLIGVAFYADAPELYDSLEIEE